jgi:NAD(P)H-dependent flavin oxidoreductase YrpB (nitropropane dioxygenase family)
MKRLALVLTVMAAGMALLSVGSAAGAVTTAKSTVTILSGEGTEFRGKVTSTKKQCRANRKVTLFRKSDSGGAYSAVGTDKTDASGAWEMQGTFMAGMYYARVASTLIRANGVPIRCDFDINVAMHF